MEVLEDIDIEVSEITSEQLHNKGFSLMSYDGELCLPNRQRTVQNVNANGELTLKGAQIFAKNVLANLQNVKDIRIIFSGSGYDVYTLTN